MSDYTYVDRDGDKLGMHPFQGERVHVIAQSKAGRMVPVYIPNADVPTVALELLKVAGQEGVIVPRSTAEVCELPYGQLKCGNVTVNAGSASELIRGRAAENAALAASYIALAEYIEGAAAREAAEKAEAEAAEKKLQERRDAHLRALGYSHSWDRAKSVLQKSVDAYLELEDRLAAK